MTAASTPVFRRSDLRDPADWKAIAKLLDDIFGIDVMVLNRLGGPDPSSVLFSYYDNDVCIANLTAFSLPLMLDGRLVRAAGFQSGAVRAEWRGRGLYSDVLKRALEWSDAKGFKLGVLLTDVPEIYEPYGFRIVPQHRFEGPPPSVCTKPVAPARSLSLESVEDGVAIRQILDRRMPVSSAFAVVRQTQMFMLNALDPAVQLSLVEEANAILAWQIADGGRFDLLDIAGSSIPDLASIVAALCIVPPVVSVYFPPDRLGWTGHAIQDTSDMHLMIRGLEGSLPGPIMLSPMANF